MNNYIQVDLDALEKSISCSCNPEMIDCINELRLARDRINFLESEVNRLRDEVIYFRLNRNSSESYWADHE